MKKKDTGEMSLYKTLKQYSRQNTVPMHMPGHKRNLNLLNKDFPWALDVTEVDGFDHLHNPTGILDTAMNQAAKLWGSQKARFLVNGSTGGILAGIRACTHRRDKVLVAANCHQSVFHAIELCGLQPVYLQVPIDPAFGICTSVRPKDVLQHLKREQDIRLVVLTSPTYEGVISDIRTIAQLVHKAGIPLLVDEAHGAHLNLTQGFTGGSIRAGADVVIHSLHKMLPALTQTAVIHIQGSVVDQNRLYHQLAVFQTSSPSYVFLSCMEQCVSLLEQERESLFDKWEQNLADFDEAINPLKHIRVLCHGKDTLENHPDIFQFDKGKLLISLTDTAYTGSEFLEQLLTKHGIQLEMAMGNYALAMTSCCDEKENMERLAKALVHMDNLCPVNESKTQLFTMPDLPPQSMPIEQALESDGQSVPLAECAGKISKEYLWAYPPGVPLLLPGQRVTKALIKAIGCFQQQGIQLQSTSGEMPRFLQAVKEKSTGLSHF